MLAFCASTLGVPVDQGSSTLDSAVALAKLPKDDGCNQNTEYYMTASGGEGHSGGSLFVYTANDVNPAPGTEIELSGIDGITWTVQPDPEGYPKDDSKFAKAPESFEVKTSDGEPHGLPYDLQNSAPCFMKNEYYYLSPGGFGHSPENHNDGGHLYVYAGGIAPEPGTKVVLSQFPDKVFVVEELPEDVGAKDTKFKEGAGAGSFSIKTADGQPHKIDKKLLNEGDIELDRDQSMKGTWKCLGAVAGQPDKPIGTFKCLGATPEITVHGDPIFKFGEKHNATRLWLPSDKLTPLLKWNSEGGRPMQLLGKTFHPKGGKGDVSKNNEVRLDRPRPGRACAILARPLPCPHHSSLLLAPPPPSPCPRSGSTSSSSSTVSPPCWTCPPMWTSLVP